MKVRTRAAVAIVAMLVAGVAGLVILPSAGAATSLVFNERLTNEQWLYSDGTTSIHPNRPPGPGDRFVLRFDVSQGATLVGFANVECTVIFNDNTLCTGVDAIAGKGDLVQTGLIRSAANGQPQVFDLAITGGTFGFRGARGDIHHQATGVGTETQTVNLR